MVNVFLLVMGLGLISTVSLLFVFVIYWFELDDKLLKGFEPTFRKMVDWLKE